MLKAPVYSADGRHTGERELPEVLFDGVVHEAAMWQAVKAYMANQRQANAVTKTRAEVSGGNKKPWRQKGTGRARQGSIRSPHWRGGGVVFGPRQGRNYKEDVPRQVRWLARRSAYNARALAHAIVLVERLDPDRPRTKNMASLLKGAALAGSVLLLTDGHKPVVHLSARNIPGLQVRPFGEETTYDVLRADRVIIESSALDRAAEVAHA
jgi:large subunit ribosomal protein L4